MNSRRVSNGSEKTTLRPSAPAISGDEASAASQHTLSNEADSNQPGHLLTSQQDISPEISRGVSAHDTSLPSSSSHQADGVHLTSTDSEEQVGQDRIDTAVSDNFHISPAREVDRAAGQKPRFGPFSIKSLKNTQSKALSSVKKSLSTASDLIRDKTTLVMESIYQKVAPNQQQSGRHDSHMSTLVFPHQPAADSRLHSSELQLAVSELASQPSHPITEETKPRRHSVIGQSLSPAQSSEYHHSVSQS